MKEVIGVCLGSSTVSFVKAGKNSGNEINIIDKISIAHNGNPKKVFKDNLINFNKDKLPVVITGRKLRFMINLDSISEPEATEYALDHINNTKEEFTAIDSLGGETFMVYNIDETGKISSLVTKNQCASGTGEFFLQQISLKKSKSC
ncbi:MAG: hypothetical protein HZB41_02395 [Ignavibacteriae bacterium]|nr:hypothetical protein [Ignavibacteriota bacterium]